MPGVNFRTYFIIILTFIILLCMTIPWSKAGAVPPVHQKPEMIYRIRIANDLDFMDNRLSGIKVKNIRLPEHSRIEIANNPWSYLVVYLGIENTWYWEGQEMLHAVEAGVSIRGTEVHEGSGWHSFINYYPKKKYEPYNDPEAWRGPELPIGQPINLELRVGEVEEVAGSYRWQVHYYVNGEEVAVRPIYANDGQPNQFDVKLCVGAYMASGRENEISFAPVKIGDIAVSESSTEFKAWQTLELEDFGIPHHRIGYGTEVDNTVKRDFKTAFEKTDYSYAVSLPKSDKSGLALFTILATLMYLAAN